MDGMVNIGHRSSNSTFGTNNTGGLLWMFKKLHNQISIVSYEAKKTSNWVLKKNWGQLDICIFAGSPHVSPLCRDSGQRWADLHPCDGARKPKHQNFHWNFIQNKFIYKRRRLSRDQFEKTGLDLRRFEKVEKIVSLRQLVPNSSCF